MLTQKILLYKFFVSSACDKSIYLGLLFQYFEQKSYSCSDLSFLLIQRLYTTTEVLDFEFNKFYCKNFCCSNREQKSSKRQYMLENVEETLGQLNINTRNLYKKQCLLTISTRQEVLYFVDFLMLSRPVISILFTLTIIIIGESGRVRATRIEFFASIMLFTDVRAYCKQPIFYRASSY